MTYVSSTVASQNGTSIGAGTVDADIVRLDVIVTGENTPLTATSVTSTNGSTSPVTDNVITVKFIILEHHPLSPMQIYLVQ